MTLTRIQIICLLISVVVFTIGNVSSGQELKVATFNASLYRNTSGELAKELKSGDSQPAKKVAEILQIVRPDLLLINEFDYDASGTAIESFKKNYLAIAQNGQKPIEFKYHFAPPVNTGVRSGMDLDNDGSIVGPGDAFGFGRFPGQYGFVVLSRFPIDAKATRTFQKFLWKDMPGALLPKNKDKTHYYSKEERDVFRLSSKNHCDVVLKVGTKRLHFLVSHPTPPVFDKDEDRNGRRNHDEIRFWNDYVDPEKSKYIYDDKGARGGMDSNSCFVIAGDLNADPNDGDSTNNPIGLFAKNRRINFKVRPVSDRGEFESKLGAANRRHRGDPAMDTADFNDETVGNLRVDYVVPSSHFKVLDSGVFWPDKNNPQSHLVDVSDHRLVWIKISWP